MKFLVELLGVQKRDVVRAALPIGALWRGEEGRTGRGWITEIVAEDVPAVPPHPVMAVGIGLEHAREFLAASLHELVEAEVGVVRVAVVQRIGGRAVLLRISLPPSEEVRRHVSLEWVADRGHEALRVVIEGKFVTRPMFGLQLLVAGVVPSAEPPIVETIPPVVGRFAVVDPAENL